MTKGGNELMKMLVAGMGSMLVTGASAFLVFGNDKVTHDEMVMYMETGSPWAREKPVVDLELRRNREALDRLQQAVEKLSDEQKAMAGEQRVLLEKISRALDNVHR